MFHLIQSIYALHFDSENAKTVFNKNIHNMLFILIPNMLFIFFRKTVFTFIHNTVFTFIHNTVFTFVHNTVFTFIHNTVFIFIHNTLFIYICNFFFIFIRTTNLQADNLRSTKAPYIEVYLQLFWISKEFRISDELDTQNYNNQIIIFQFP